MKGAPPNASALFPAAPVKPKLISRGSFLKIFEGSAIYHPEHIYDFKLDRPFQVCCVSGLRKLLCFAAVRQSNRILADQNNRRINIHNCLYVPLILRFTIVQNKELFIVKFFARTALLKYLQLQRRAWFLIWGYT